MNRTKRIGVRSSVKASKNAEIGQEQKVYVWGAALGHRKEIKPYARDVMRCRRKHNVDTIKD